MAARAFITGLAGAVLTADERAFLREARPWGLILFKRNIQDIAQVYGLVKDCLDAIGVSGTPVLVDQEGGRVQRLGPPHWPAYPPGAAYGGLNPYPRSWLMAAGIPTVFGYHGNQLTTWDDLLGGKESWQNQLNPNLWKLLAVRYIVLTEPQNLPGFHQVLGPEKTFHGSAYLFEADTVPPYARVYAGAAKVAEAQLVPTLTDPRFPIEQLALYADTTSVNPAPIENKIPAPSTRRAEVIEWRAGKMKIAITGSSPAPEYLVVAENWDPNWRATIDGKPAPVLRAQNTLLSVVLAPDAREVTLEFDSPEYRRGRLISILSAIGVLALFSAPLMMRRTRPNG